MANRVGRPRDTTKVGKLFGRLLVLAPVYKDGVPAWECKCSCGNRHTVKNVDLKNTKSCGCFRRDLGRANKVHGMHGTPTYEAWHAMKQRCLNPNHKAWKNYGGRGITVCRKWANSFEAFLLDMGERPDGASLDRIDNAKGYRPSNCRWSTAVEQARNRRTNKVFIVAKKRMTLAEISEHCGLSVQALSWRIYKIGMSAEEAMRTPLLRKRKHGNNS